MDILEQLQTRNSTGLLKSDYRIGIIGAGFIVRDVQLVAYQNAGYQIAAIASRTPESAKAVADLRGIPKVYDTVEELLFDSDIQIVDIAIPPTEQLAVVRKVVQQASHIKGILAQKPLAMNYADALRTVQLCAEAGVKLAVNQNMRFDPSIVAGKLLLQQHLLGEPVFATIEMRAVPHWQTWLQDHDRLSLLNMSIHHLDCFRFLFGTPDSVYVSARKDPRTSFDHRDGICAYILEYQSGLRVAAWDDIWAGPGANNEEVGAYIKWRIEGTEGVAQGTIGWPGYPNRTPSTIEFTSSKYPGYRFEPLRKRPWFPDAFEETMAELMNMVTTGADSHTSGKDNLETMALVDACYLSLDEHRPATIQEIKEKEGGLL